jgi:hypothetical protein
MVTPLAIVGGSVAALACAIALVALVRAGRVPQASLYLGDFVWIGLTAGLVTGSGGRSSPFFLFYPMAVCTPARFSAGSGWC